MGARVVVTRDHLSCEHGGRLREMAKLQFGALEKFFSLVFIVFLDEAAKNCSFPL